MLPAHTQELLTAFVDGELSAAEKRLVEKLLRESDEARAFHGQIQKQSQRLRTLPTAVPSDDLAASIMNMISDRGMMPTPLPMPRRHGAAAQRLLPWISIATAATVVIAVGLFAYLYHVVSAKQFADKTPADNRTDVIPNNNVVAKVQPPVVVPNNSTEEKVEVGSALQMIEPELGLENKQDVAIEKLPVMPRIKGVPDTIFGTPPQPEVVEPFRQFKVTLPLLLPLQDLDQPYPKQKLRQELKQNEVVRVDLFTKDGWRAAELVQAVMKARGQQVLVDATALGLIRKKTKGEFVVYTESLTADEIAQVLETLGADDKRLEAKKPSESQFDKFMLAPFMVNDLNELSKLLGVPASVLKMPKPKNVTIDPRKPLEAITAAQLMANLPKAASRGNDKTTLILPYGTSTLSPPATSASKEIKSFLDKRGDRKPNTIPLMLVLKVIG